MRTTFITTVTQAEDVNATGLPVPAEAVAALGTKKHSPVKVTLNKYTYRSTVAAYGDVFMLPRAPGVYLLLLSLPVRIEAQIGRLRWIDFDPGLYGYAGSALGSGGLAARLQRHMSRAGCRHWHIDYLLPHARPLGALVREDSQRLECSWAAWAGGQAQACIRGFGSSDCACPGHLFLLGPAVDEARFIEQARRELVARWYPSHAP